MPDRPADVTAAAATSPPGGFFARLGHADICAPCAVTSGWAGTATTQRAANMRATAEREKLSFVQTKEDRRKNKQGFDDKTKQ